MERDLAGTGRDRVFRLLGRERSLGSRAERNARGLPHQRPRGFAMPVPWASLPLSPGYGSGEAIWNNGGNEEEAVLDARRSQRLLDPLFTTETMRGIFSDHGRLQGMLDFEAALARAEARVGL